MSAATMCGHCKTTPVAKQLTTTVLGSVPVTVAMCRCDYLTCCHCDTTVYDRYARRCANCGKDPGSKY